MLAAAGLAGVYLFTRQRALAATPIQGPTAASPMSTFDKICQVGTMGAGAYYGGAPGAAVAGAASPLVCGAVKTVGGELARYPGAAVKYGKTVYHAAGKVVCLGGLLC